MSRLLASAPRVEPDVAAEHRAALERAAARERRDRVADALVYGRADRREQAQRDRRARELPPEARR